MKDKKQNSTLHALDKLIEWNKTADVPKTSATVAVRTSTMRRLLKIKKNEDLVYKGLRITCIGSQRWRSNNWCGEKP